jgi:hypothetical protein
MGLVDEGFRSKAFVELSLWSHWRWATPEQEGKKASPVSGATCSAGRYWQLWYYPGLGQGLDDLKEQAGGLEGIEGLDLTTGDLLTIDFLDCYKTSHSNIACLLYLVLNTAVEPLSATADTHERSLLSRCYNAGTSMGGEQTCCD